MLSFTDLADVRQRDLRSDVEEEPSEEELEKVVNTLKTGTSGGSKGVQPEVVKHVGLAFNG